MGVAQGTVSAIDHAIPSATELATLARYVESLGSRLEIIANSGDKRLAFTEPGTEAAGPLFWLYEFPDPGKSHRLLCSSLGHIIWLCREFCDPVTQGAK
jgi:hypothetical protein